MMVELPNGGRVTDAQFGAIFVAVAQLYDAGSFIHASHLPTPYLHWEDCVWHCCHSVKVARDLMLEVFGSGH